MFSSYLICSLLNKKSRDVICMWYSFFFPLRKKKANLDLGRRPMFVYQWSRKKCNAPIFCFVLFFTNYTNVTVKTFKMFQKIYISINCFSIELSIILENVIYHIFHKNIKQHNCFQHW